MYRHDIKIEDIDNYLKNLQQHLCTRLEQVEVNCFKEEKWEYNNECGGGITRILEFGECLERAGVNFSHVHGIALPASATMTRPELQGANFEAMGVSVVIHPKNPYVPTSHLNVRLLVAHRSDQEPLWWFGGGYDLTPYYPFMEDCVHWHQTAEKTCRPFGSLIYPQCKKACDEYFYIPHRKEARGIGGLFFDDLNQWPFEKCFAFMQAVGNSFIEAYEPILLRRKNHPFSEQEKQFQLYRRGRYVEFNLVYDRGTLFGLQSEGRTESILMSLPPEVHWAYDWKPVPGSRESRLYEYLQPRDWLKMNDEI